MENLSLKEGEKKGDTRQETGDSKELVSNQMTSTWRH